MSGFWALFYKEYLRFWKVSFQTVFAPVLTALLYLLVFAHVVQARAQTFADVSYEQFLVPGLVMMSLLQNAFANSSSSLAQSKLTGNIVFVLLPPLSYLEFFGAYVLASLVRGLIVAAGVLLAAMIFVTVPMAYPLWAITFAVLGGTILGALGVIAGIWAEKIDQLAVFQNFFILPATFLSGVFYSIHALPPLWQTMSMLNPFFYMIDGFRYGFFGHADVDPMLSLAVVVAALAVLSVLAVAMLRTGYKLRH